LFVDRIGRLKPEQGLYLRRFRVANDGPHLVVEPGCEANSSQCTWPPRINAQVGFLCGGDGEMCPKLEKLASPSGDLWKLEVVGSEWAREMHRYKADIGNSQALVGVKVKHGGQAFYLHNGDDIAFIDVRWVGHSRGIMMNVNNVVLKNTRVDRDEQNTNTVALATPGGGPQVNNCTNLTIFNHTAVGTGDDSLGLFNIRSGSVTGCHIRDSFARGILLYQVADDVQVKGNDAVRCPVYRAPRGDFGRFG